MIDKSNNLIYFDNSATSWPKPPGVAEAMTQFLTQIGANPGRSGHQLAVKSSRLVYDVREKITTLFNAPDPLKVIFSKNITEALNLALYGLLQPGDHVITSSMEHNAVMRPLRDLAQKGVELSMVECSPEGQLDTSMVKRLIRPNTRLIAINHGSNVTGTLLPIAEVGAIAQQQQCLMLVDTAQTAGKLPIDMASLGIDLLAFTGHKSLLGPMGTGGLIFGERVDPQQFEPRIRGGTGSRSEEEYQPKFLPDMFESGTQNAVGLAGLGAAIDWILEKGINNIKSFEKNLTQKLLDGLRNIPGVCVYGPQSSAHNAGTVSFNIQSLAPSEVGLRLDEEFGILARVGLHCSPAAHKTIGTFPGGTVRFGLSIFNREQEVDRAVKAIASLTSEANN
jgi:cysteine desulfurase / selenocysteine lyase